MSIFRVHIPETNSYPIVLHGNGYSSRQEGGIFQQICDSFFEESLRSQLFHFIRKNSIKRLKNSILDISNTTIVSWKGGKYLNSDTLLEKSLRYHNVDFRMFGWPEGMDFWDSTKYKLKYVNEAIDNGEIDTEYLMWFDCGDVLLMEHPIQILFRYEKYYSDYQMVFNAERNDYPHLKRMQDENVNSKIIDLTLKVSDYLDSLKHGSSFKYLNSGAMVGKTGFVKKFIDRCFDIGFSERFGGDQHLCKLAQFDLKEDVAIDHDCKIFCCFHSLNRDEVSMARNLS